MPWLGGVVNCVANGKILDEKFLINYGYNLQAVMQALH